MRISDIFLAVPQIVLAIAISQTLGPSIENVILALSVTYWPWFTRLVHAEVRSLKNETFIEAAIALGVPVWRIILLHVLPNVMSPIIVRTSIGMGFTILTASALGFLGLGAPPPAPEEMTDRGVFSLAMSPIRSAKAASSPPSRFCARLTVQTRLRPFGRKRAQPQPRCRVLDPLRLYDYAGIWESGTGPQRQLIRFADGQTEAQVSIRIQQDSLIEGDETVRLYLANPTGGQVRGQIKTALLTIVDDEQPPTLTVGSVEATEGNPTDTGGGVVTLNIPVTLSAPSTVPVQVDWTLASGTAFRDSDYSVDENLLRFITFSPESL